LYFVNLVRLVSFIGPSIHPYDLFFMLLNLVCNYTETLRPRGSVEKYNYKLALKIPLDKSKKKSVYTFSIPCELDTFSVSCMLKLNALLMQHL